NDDSGRHLFCRLKYAKSKSPVRRRTSRELRQLSSGSPAPLLFAAIGVADQRRRVRLWVIGGKIEEKNIGVALTLQIREPDARSGCLPIVPIARYPLGKGLPQSVRKDLSPKFLSFRIHDDQCRTVQPPKLGLVGHRKNSDGNVRRDAKGGSKHRDWNDFLFL